jgi:hypothetical protein
VVGDAGERVVLALAHAHPGLRHHRRPAAAAIVAAVCESRKKNR